IGEDLRLELRVRHGTGVTSHGATGHRGLAAERHLVFEESIRAFAVHHQEHEIDCFAANLKTEASLLHLHDCRGAPVAAIAAAHYALPELTADEERGFFQCREDS